MITQKIESEREKLHALNLAKECYSMKLDMLTNATVIDDTIRFIAVNAANNDKEKKEKAKSHYSDKENIDDVSGSRKKILQNQQFQQ